MLCPLYDHLEDSGVSMGRPEEAHVAGGWSWWACPRGRSERFPVRSDQRSCADTASTTGSFFVPGMLYVDHVPRMHEGSEIGNNPKAMLHAALAAALLLLLLQCCTAPLHH